MALNETVVLEIQRYHVFTVVPWVNDCQHLVLLILCVAEVQIVNVQIF